MKMLYRYPNEAVTVSVEYTFTAGSEKLAWDVEDQLRNHLRELVGTMGVEPLIDAHDLSVALRDVEEAREGDSNDGEIASLNLALGLAVDMLRALGLRVDASDAAPAAHADADAEDSTSGQDRDSYAVTRQQILPGQELDGGTVVASVYLNDDDPDQTSVLVLLLMPTPGRHYRVVEAWEKTRAVYTSADYENIVPAVQAYVENGGDY